ncbi:MAG: ferrous iron transporter B [Actinobacteria bacterium]|nr:ferrous iron transporter B [Actinomycetota bacterium]
MPGVEAVLTLLPVLLALFIALAFLEDSGYLARAVFLIQRLMALLGLPGQAFLPLMLGFGCTVPAVMATCILADRRDRLPVYVLIAGAALAQQAGAALVALYGLGVVAALATGLLLRRTGLRGPSSPFILELPACHLPSLRTLGLTAWLRLKPFLLHRSRFIAAGALLVWLLGSMPWGVGFGSRASWLGAIGAALEPLLAPLGLGGREVVALLVGKELVVGALGVLYAGTATAEAVDTAGLASAIGQALTPAAAAALLVFVLLYVPCSAAFATIRGETGSWRWTIGQAVYSLLLAWLAGLAVFQLGRAVGLG